MSEVKIGKLLSGGETRDAIHIAVAPVVATVRLRPGEHIGFVEQGDDSKVGFTRKPIGIVDPYLKEDVEEGEAFYMHLYPNTVTSLQHAWTHPAFGPEMSVREQAEAWMTWFAITRNSSKDELLAGAMAYLTEGTSMYDGSRFDGVSVNDEFWNKFEVLTGHKVPEDERSNNFFSCSC